jgi:hypothetical protein
MASFIIHTLSAEMLLKELENKYQIALSQELTNKFLLGNLIVDSLRIDMTIPQNLTEQEQLDYKMYLKRKNREEKVSTHFRNPSNEDNILKLPEPSLFIEKYRNLLSQDISVLGYLFHLYTDKLFFSYLFPKTFISLKNDGSIATKEKESHIIRILKSNEEVLDKVFWTGTSPLSIYSDYTILNKLLLEHYGTSFNADNLIEFAINNFKNPGIKEVDYSKITEIIYKTKKFIEDSYSSEKIVLNVFNEEIVKEFINLVATSFLDEYEYLFSPYIQKATNNIKKGKVI